jgi:hypothetical protein
MQVLSFDGGVPYIPSSLLKVRLLGSLVLLAFLLRGSVLFVGVSKSPCGPDRNFNFLCSPSWLAKGPRLMDVSSPFWAVYPPSKKEK